ncbi:hypothetical protein CsatB_016200 [Cannabis sativa]
MQQELTPIVAELLAIQGGLRAGIQRGLRRFALETDCLGAVQLIKDTKEGCRDIDGLLF